MTFMMKASTKQKNKSYRVTFLLLTAISLIITSVVTVVVAVEVSSSSSTRTTTTAPVTTATENNNYCDNNDGEYCDDYSSSSVDDDKEETKTKKNTNWLFDFLKDDVFGQKDTGINNDNTDNDNNNGIAEQSLKNTPFFEIHNIIKSVADSVNFKGNDDNDSDNNNNNPFLSFISEVKHTTDSLFGGATTKKKDDDSDKNSNDKENEHALIPQLLQQAQKVVQNEDSIGGMELLQRIKVALKQAATQLQDNFGGLVKSNDFDTTRAIFAIPYYFEQIDRLHGTLWNRKMHRFYQKVSKQELIELHDALYLSHLAYVDTIKQFLLGLEQFQSRSWRMLYGTTTSLPDLPASFLIIHKQLSPLEAKPKNPGHKFVNFITKKIHRNGDSKDDDVVVVTLVIRGTKELTDVLADGTLEPRAYKDGYAHGGILSGGINLAEYYLPKLKELHFTTKRKIRLVIIGHSLGAGSAVIAGMELKEHESFLDIEVIGFGCPALLSKGLAESTKDYITTVVNDADIIPRMSGSSITNLLLDLLEYDWTDDAIGDIQFTLERGKFLFTNIGGISSNKFMPDTDVIINWVNDYLNKKVRPKFYYDSAEDDADESNIVDVGDDSNNDITEDNENKQKRRSIKKKIIRNRIPNLLVPPGQVIHLFRDGYGFTATYTPSDFFTSVNFAITLIDDHLIPTGYHRALLSAAQDTDRDYKFQFSNDLLSITGV